MVRHYFNHEDSRFYADPDKNNPAVWRIYNAKTDDFLNEITIPEDTDILDFAQTIKKDLENQVLEQTLETSDHVS